jgi:hypothetical protein
MSSGSPIMFRTVATAKKYNGVFESPAPLRMALI